jgi:hypothetical protein
MEVSIRLQRKVWEARQSATGSGSLQAAFERVMHEAVGVKLEDVMETPGRWRLQECRMCAAEENCR